MKSYLNPQPYAVDRLDKIQEPSEKKSKSKSQGLKAHYWRTDKEIYKHESEEQAWRDVLRKNISHSGTI